MSSTGHSLPTDPVDRAIARARGVLPDQGPIGVFIHHNTLHAYQHLPFHEGVQAGADALGARPYLSQREFREAMASSRIAEADVRHEIDEALGERGAELIVPGSRAPSRGTSSWRQTATPTMRRGSSLASSPAARWSAATWPAGQLASSVCPEGPAYAAPDTRAFRRHRDVLEALGARDTDIAVHGELIRMSSGFLDQGQAHAVAPERARGFLHAVTITYVQGASAPAACRGAEADMRAVAHEKQTPTAVIRASLDALGVHGDDVEPFLFATALALPGWTGMFSRLELHPEDNPDGPPVSLEEFLAVRLLLERRAVQNATAAARAPHEWPALRLLAPPPPARASILDASLLWTLAGAAGMSPDAVRALDPSGLAALWAECAACTDLDRRRVFQNAYERTYRRMILDAMAARRGLPDDAVTGRPRAQFVFCIDEREESIRRALEEQHPEYITFGMAGFFGVAIDYLGLYDRKPAAHSPVVVIPGHEVHEQPVYTSVGRHHVSRRWRERWLAVERRAVSASRTLSGGASMSFLLGPLSAVKTVARVAAPRSSLRFGEKVASHLAPFPTTRLSTMRVDDAARITDGRKPVGFSLEESVDRVTAVLNNLGLVRDFAPVVIFLGHGSTSLNNPHESAHDCGACGGRRGGANARLFADMANRLDVREGVRHRGIDIPSDTWFVGALHDTADDSVRYYDLEALPASVATRFEEAYEALERARRENARERARRFDNAPLDITPEEALRHVEARSAHLAQPRPEYGHCTNSACYVGRRALIRGLHLDRRAFLVSYDPTIDTDHKILERILAAVGPVGAGISLEYYFSSVDNETFGCGTKLPHNVTGLIGVMNGHQSDLRTGLPLQMVEIHEPMRLLIMVDATPEALLAVAGRQAEVAELVVKDWVQLVSIHPETGAMMVFSRGGFVPYEPLPTLLPVVERSPEWHMRTRAHISPALVRAALPESAVGPGHSGARAVAGVASV